MTKRSPGASTSHSARSDAPQQPICSHALATFPDTWHDRRPGTTPLALLSPAALPLRPSRPSLCRSPRCPEEDSNLYAPEGTGGFKPPASAVPPPGRGVRGYGPPSGSAVRSISTGVTAARSRRRTDSAVAASSRFATTIPSIMSSATAPDPRPRSWIATTVPSRRRRIVRGTARPAGRAAERGHLEPRLAALGREEPRHGRKSGRRHPLHPCTLARGCDRPARVGRWGGRRRAWRSPHDREIVRLALPAFGALIAEPLYLLADTAIVGHLGTRPLGGIAIAAIVLTATFGIFNFLAYTTTGTVARHVGAGDERAAVGARHRRHLARGRPRARPHGGRACSPSRSITSTSWARPHAVRPYAPSTCASRCSARRSC